MKRMDYELELHRAAIKQCRRCGHPKDVHPIVSIARSPKVMLVGQAPGKTEAAGGAPFSGRAGRTLFGWFETIGLDEATARARIYISAVTRCYPGPSASGRGDRVPSPTERSNCFEWLASELRLIRPVLVIPVGRLAIDEFLGPRSLDEVVGKEHEVTSEARCLLPSDARRMVVIPLPHPSGASSWVHVGDHAELLCDALRLIARRWHSVYRTRSVA